MIQVYGPFLSREQALEKGLDRFYDGKPCRNGHVSVRILRRNTSRCLACDHARDRKRRPAKTPRLTLSRRPAMFKAEWFEETQTKRCGKCGAIKPKSKFYKSKNTRCGLAPWCKECCAASGRSSRDKRHQYIELKATVMIKTCQASAKARGQECTISREWICRQWELQGQRCAYTGKLMTLKPGCKTGQKLIRWNGVSIDRKNNDVGYIPENCFLVCYGVNAMKSNLPWQLFLDMCRDVSGHAESLGAAARGAA